MSDQPTDSAGPHPRGEQTELDSLFSTLANGHRRTVLRYFQASEDDVTTVDELVDYTLSQEDIPEDRDRLAVRFHHSTLPHLAAAGVVEYDARSNTVRYRSSRLTERVMNAITEVEAIS